MGWVPGTTFAGFSAAHSLFGAHFDRWEVRQHRLHCIRAECKILTKAVTAGKRLQFARSLHCANPAERHLH